MIIEFNQEKATITFNGGRFVCLFIHHGFKNKSLEISVFETDLNFRPIDLKMPLFTKEVPMDEHTILSTIRIIGELDSGTAIWIPNKYLIKNRGSKDVQDLEKMSAQMTFSMVRILLNKKDYFAASLNINNSLLSRYIRENPKYESRLLRMQAEAYTGFDRDYITNSKYKSQYPINFNNYIEAKKALLRAKELYNEDSDFQDYFILGIIEYKLNNKKISLENLEKFIKLANIFLKSSNDLEKNKEIIEGIGKSNELINKLK